MSRESQNTASSPTAVMRAIVHALQAAVNGFAKEDFPHFFTEFES
jgi:hypothetical protein